MLCLTLEQWKVPYGFFSEHCPGSLEPTLHAALVSRERSY